MRQLLILLHLAGVIVWVGGMFFANFCLRPVAAKQLPPAQRLPLLAAVLGRFFTAVGGAIVAILGSGLATMLATGFASAPWYWHVMMTLGLAMSLIFAIIAGLHYPRLNAAVARQDWPAGGAAMNRIRQLVATNLMLGTATIIIATVGSRLG